jgi:alcohol dehydrogenase
LATQVGASAVINSASCPEVVQQVREISGGGVKLSIDALGSSETCYNSIANLRKRGRHVQVGLMAGQDYHPNIPMELVIANELEIVGSHGMQAHEYDRMLQMILSGELQPGRLVGQRVSLEQAAAALGDPGKIQTAGVSVIDQF